MGKDLESLHRTEEVKLTPRASNPSAVSENKSLIYLCNSSFFVFCLFCFAFCCFLEVSFAVVVFSLLVLQPMHKLEPRLRKENKKLPIGNSFYLNKYKISMIMKIS